jgi:hypothetical protein
MIAPKRCQHITQKIPKERTGLSSSIFVHVDYVGDTGARTVIGVRMSEKGKSDSTLDKVLTALGDTLTAIIREEINAPEPEGLHVVANDEERGLD